MQANRRRTTSATSQDALFRTTHLSTSTRSAARWCQLNAPYMSRYNWIFLLNWAGGIRFCGRASSAGRILAGKPYFRGRLTKAILMSLPAGVILESNVGHEPFAPVFEVVLGSMAEREEVWVKMRGLKVTGRMFWAFATKKSYEHQLRERLNPPEPNVSTLEGEC